MDLFCPAAVGHSPLALPVPLINFSRVIHNQTAAAAGLAALKLT
jgi:hypothetical protein